jgi:hypothetical protein
MTPAALLSELTARGVELVARGDNLRFRPADRVTPDELVLIRRHKAVIRKLLADAPSDRPAQPTTSWPIIEGSEHFSLWVADPGGAWPEFVPGHHVDLRRPSRLRALCD